MSDRKKIVSKSIFEEFRAPPSKTSIKIVLLGDGSIGKTSFFQRITQSNDPNYKFSKVYDATQGCNICQIEYKIGKYPVTIHLFDTAGQEKFGMLRDSYLTGADAVILMYDLSDIRTKQSVLSTWLPNIMRSITASGYKQRVPVAVIGNKNDKIDSSEHRPDFNPVGLRTATLVGAYDMFQFGAIEHFYVSVKAEEGLMNPVNWLLRSVLNYYIPVDAQRSDKTPITYMCNNTK